MILKILEDGPILVIKDDQSTPMMALCRCGNSKNNPYCDGSHKGCGFKADGDVIVIDDNGGWVTEQIEL